MNPDFIISPARLKAIVESQKAEEAEKPSEGPAKAPEEVPMDEITPEEAQALTEDPPASGEELPLEPTGEDRLPEGDGMGGDPLDPLE